jgi:DNA phosphorothioation-associated putative methyltransferase
MADRVIARHVTAIRRYDYSRPISLALAHGIITADTSVFDYGCGRGEDVKFLIADGIRASGWDPHYKPDARIERADVVNLGYVLNVIEDPTEREKTLRDAFELAKSVLIVSVRLDHNLETVVPFTDGFLTTKGSFQKIYSQAEFREYLEGVLDHRPQMATLGTAYLFKDPDCESRYLGNSLRVQRGHRELSRETFHNSVVGESYLAVAKQLGRFPLAAEFSQYNELIEEFGSASRVERIARSILAPETLVESRARRQEDILTYLSMLKLRGLRPPPFRLLPKEVQADIKMLWASYQDAVTDGDRFLYQLADPSVVRKACASAEVGKKLPEAFYVHKSAEELLPALLRVILFAARQIVGEVQYDLVKISSDGRKVSFLRYPEFDENAHPALKYSLKVYLPKASYELRDYSNSENPPILHRKELFVDALYPAYEQFADLSRQEEELGLLSRSDIGYWKNWAAILQERELRIENHRLFRNG